VQGHNPIAINFIRKIGKVCQPAAEPRFYRRILTHQAARFIQLQRKTLSAGVQEPLKNAWLDDGLMAGIVDTLACYGIDASIPSASRSCWRWTASRSALLSPLPSMSSQGVFYLLLVQSQSFAGFSVG
jgi:hypothetical protein